MTLYRELFYVAIAVVFIVDISGASETLKAIASRVVGWKVKSMRPLTCSLCSVWWCCLGWCIYRHSLTIEAVAVCGLFAASADIIAQVIRTAKDVARAVLHAIDCFINYIFEKL